MRMEALSSWVTDGDGPMVEELILAVGEYGAVKPPASTYDISARSY